jgi:hypothetical protein
MAIDLKKEQQASLARPRYKYSLAAKFFFGMMDMVTGKETTLAKAKLIETLASIPYRSWEIRQYVRMTRGYKNKELVKEAFGIMHWGRAAQDNEYWHLLVIEEKMKEEGLKDPWYLFPVIPWFMVFSYVLVTRFMALVNIKRAFLFNAEFEDHAEHVYAKAVEDHPEWHDHPVLSEKLWGTYDDGQLKSWGDVFMRIGLDERDHMNKSFVYCGKPECVVEYEGMPDYSKGK